MKPLITAALLVHLALFSVIPSHAEDSHPARDDRTGTGSADDSTGHTGELRRRGHRQHGSSGTHTERDSETRSRHGDDDVRHRERERHSDRETRTDRRTESRSERRDGEERHRERVRDRNRQDGNTDRS